MSIPTCPQCLRKVIPKGFGLDFDQTLDLVRSVGYTTTVRFEKGQRRVVPLPTV